MMRTLLALAIGATCALAPRPARAQGQPVGAEQAATNDVVYLKNGGLVRGVVVSSEPGRQVVIIVLGTGERRTIPWAEVDHVQAGTAPPPQAAPAPLQVAAPPLPFPPSERIAVGPPRDLGRPRLHLDGPPNVILFGGRYSEWELGSLAGSGRIAPICYAPCDRVVDATHGANFLLAGEGVPPSSPFQLADRSGDVGMRVKPGNDVAHTLGVATFAAGLLGTLVGAGVLIAGAAEGANGAGLRTAGGVTLAASGGSVLLGLILVGGPGSTTFTFVGAN